MTDQRLDVRRLEALVAVHRTGSVSAAAASLHYGQPTISHHLQRLEAETGSVLVQRVGRGVRLTADGERLARRGEEILGLIARAGEELAAARSLQAGRVRVAAFPSAAATLVPRLVGELAERAPGLAVELIEAEPPEAIDLLRSGAADVALLFSYDTAGAAGASDATPSASAAGVESERLFRDPLVLVTPLAETRTRLEQLADARWVTGCERCRRELLDLCHRAGFEPHIAFASDDSVAVQALVAAGFGVTVLPQLALTAHRHPQVRVTELAEARTVSVATYGRPPRPASIDAVVAAVAAVVETVPTTVEATTGSAAGS